MPADGDVTLGLFDKDGHLLRWLARDAYRYAGSNREAWDGLDQYGQPVPAGTYTLKGLYHAPVTLDYKATVCDPGTPPWPSPDGKGDWLSDESNPQAAVSDGKWVFLGTPNFEKGSSIIGVDETGHKQWGFDGGQARCVSLALDGDYLYAVYSGPHLTGPRPYTGKNAIEQATLFCIDKKTGRPAKFTANTPGNIVATWPYREAYSFLWDLRDKKAFTPQVYGGQPHYFLNDVGESTSALGLAALGNKLYVSMNYDYQLLVVDAETGKPTGDTIPVDNPVGLCPLDDHTLLAVSGQQVVKVDVNSKAVTPLITSHLVAPDSVSTDKDGNIYVSDWGTSFQVKVFDANGNFLRAIGKEGGRPWIGTWDSNGMLVPRGVAVTDDGKLWVAEDDGTPRRVSVWDAKSGAFLKDYLGPAPYGCCSHVWADSKDASVFHVEGTRFKIDYATKTCAPEAIDYRRSGLDAPFTPNGDGGCDEVHILYRNGQEYAAVTHGLGGGGITIMQRQGDVYQPVAAFGSIGHVGFPALAKDGTAIDASDDIGHHDYAGGRPAFFKDRTGCNFTWADLNHDFKTQENEMDWVKCSNDYAEGAQPPVAGYWGNAISSDWSIFFPAEFHDRNAIFRLDVDHWTPDGVPVYHIGSARPIAFEPHTNNISSLYVTRDNHLIASYDYEWGKSPDALACYTLDGKKLWTVVRPKEFTGAAVQSTAAVYDFNLPGLGDVFGTWAWHGDFRPFLITTDGLYVSTMLDDTKLGPKAIWGESPVFYFQGPDGTPYIVNGADDQAHILQINGLSANSCGRFEDTLQLTDDKVAEAAKQRALPAVQAPAPRPVIDIAWLDHGPAIDGDLADWNMARGVSLEGTHGRSAEVALGRDATNLYLAFHVKEPTPPLVNEGGDWQTLFTTGDCVDLMLATDSSADAHRRAAAAGDERLLFSVYQGQPVAVLYQPVSADAASPVQLAAARFDRIVKLTSAKVAVQRDASGGSYTVEASVPLADLDIDPKEQDTLQGDVGVVYADESGRSRALRLYYHNKDTAMVSDLATEATLQPSQWGVVQFPIGPNLVHNGDFEEPLLSAQDDPEKGWMAGKATNGSDVRITDESSYTGHQSMVLESPTPITFPPEAYTDRNLGYKLWGYVTVTQRVPVIAGHQYTLRYHYRTQDLQEDDRRPGHPPGFVGFGGRIDWTGATRNSIAVPERSRGIGNSSRTENEWQTVRDFFHGWDLPRLYVAPDGATAANISFGFSCRASGHSAKAFIDDVEFVDVTPPETAKVSY
ncbi:MAG TPA: hypothetical protein VHY09_06675 [Candidatus Methylacidiphilales bacterium]|jgi:hypothetical protein|nr:hypothetical protein [Candidatus Methylacidiphilales bacterium]